MPGRSALGPHGHPHNGTSGAQRSGSQLGSLASRVVVIGDDRDILPVKPIRQARRPGCDSGSNGQGRGAVRDQGQGVKLALHQADL